MNVCIPFKNRSGLRALPCASDSVDMRTCAHAPCHSYRSIICVPNCPPCALSSVPVHRTPSVVSWPTSAEPRPSSAPKQRSWSRNSYAEWQWGGGERPRAPLRSLPVCGVSCGWQRRTSGPGKAPSPKTCVAWYGTRDEARSTMKLPSKTVTTHCADHTRTPRLRNEYKTHCLQLCGCSNIHHPL